MTVSRTLVAGIDSSTQSCKVMVRDAQTGALVRSGVARHAGGTEISPLVWRRAFDEAVKAAGGLADVAAMAIGGQQHGLVPLDDAGRVVRPAILWNDTRSAADAEDLVVELGGGDVEAGRRAWADRVGLVPVASFTVTKVRWMHRAEPELFGRVCAVALPHDWLSWELGGGGDITHLVTDRSEASGTGYFEPVGNSYDRELLALAGGDVARDFVIPRVAAPAEMVGEVTVDGHTMLLAPGCGDNAGAALGLDLAPGAVSMSIGTSGVVSMVADAQTHDASGLLAGFADATGRYLPLACTLNASRVLDVYRELLGVDHRGFADLALSAPPGAEGLVCVPYLEGERTPNLPLATGALHGIQMHNLTPANIARAAVEGMLCGVGEGIRAMRRSGIEVSSVSLIGGGAQSDAVRRIAPGVLGLPVTVPEHGEYVADGAARQAAWALSGAPTPPEWVPRMRSEFAGEHQRFIEERYLEVSSMVARRDVPQSAPTTSIRSHR